MAYTLVVGTMQWSSWSLRPFLALSAIGVPFETVVIRLRVRPPEPVTTKDEILNHSPAGKVPVLKIAENGTVLTVWDSLAICETLAERHPTAKLWPDDAELRAMARSLASEMHSGFPDRHKGDFLCGGFSIADCMYAPVVSRFDTYGVAVPPAVRAYMDRIIALPTMQAWREAAQTEMTAGIA